MVVVILENTVLYVNILYFYFELACFLNLVRLSGIVFAALLFVSTRRERSTK